MGKRLSQLNLTQQVNDEDYLLIDGTSFSESKKIKIRDIINYIISHIGGGSSNVELDKSLTQPNKAAEAKATGDKIDSVAQEFDAQIQDLNIEIASLANKPIGTIVKFITWEDED